MQVTCDSIALGSHFREANLTRTSLRAILRLSLREEQIRITQSCAIILALRKMFLESVTQLARKKNLSTSNRSWRTRDLLVTNSDALPLSHRTLVEAGATKLKECSIRIYISVHYRNHI